MCRTLFHTAFQLRRHASHDQLLLRPRHRNVKHTQFLRQIFQFHALPYNLPRQCRLAHAVLRIDRIRTDTHPGMQYECRAAVHLVERFSHTREEHDRKLKSLTLVDTHNTHGICALTINIHLAEIHFILLKLFDITDKVEQAAVTRRLELHRLFHQHFQICPPLYAARHRGCIAAVARLLENLRNQFMNRRVRHTAPQQFELCEEPPQFLPKRLIFARRRIFSTRLINFYIFIHTTHHRKLCIGASADRRAENCRKWNLLAWIVAQMQIIQHRHDFLRGKVSRF